MRKISVGVFCLILAVTFGNVMVVSGQSEDETMSVPLGDILLEPPEGVEAKRSPVNFPHSIHFSYNCLTCHHKWALNEPVVGCMTTACHEVKESPVKAGQGKVDDAQLIKYYKTAYHRMCINCHKDIKAQNKKLEMSGRILKENLPNSGPTSCIQCHPKEEE